MPETIAPFTILLSPAERSPYQFARIRARVGGEWVTLSVPTAISELPAGAYSIQGYAQHVAIARLSLAELFRVCGVGRDDFTLDLERLAGVPSAHLVLECHLSDIFESPPAGTKMKPRSVAGSIFAWSERYGVVPWFAGTRQYGEWVTWQILDRWWQELHGAGLRSVTRAARRQVREFLRPMLVAGDDTTQRERTAVVPRVAVLGDDAQTFF